jgi:hypothetical protein
VDNPHAGDDAGGRRLSFVLIVGDQQADFDEARAFVTQPFDAFARGELFLLVLARDPLGSAAESEGGFQLADLRVELAESGRHASCFWRSANHPVM